MKTDDSRMERENIFRSTLISLSSITRILRTEFKPYVSMIMRTESESRSKGFPQIHSPLVQGIVVGPIAKPVILFSSRFDKNDLPVL